MLIFTIVFTFECKFLSEKISHSMDNCAKDGGEERFFKYPLC